MFDIHKYLSKGILSFGAIGLYDYFVENRSFDFVKTDGLTFTVANLVGLLSSDLLFEFLNLSKSGTVGMLTEPLVSSLIYMYLYNNMVYAKYYNLYTNQRGSTNNFLTSATLNILVKFIENPLLSFWGWKN